jgi:S1-C subfamily serine protease
MSEFMGDAKKKVASAETIARSCSFSRRHRFAFCGRFGMSRNVLSLAFWLMATVSILLATAKPSSASGPLETSGDGRWIVFASRQDVDEAIGLARRFGSDFGGPTVLTTTNDWYAVAAGPIAVPDVATFKKRLSDAWWAPKDTFLTNGQTFIQKVWESPKSPILASASNAEHRPRVASAAGLEVRIEPAKGRQVVRVRSGGRDVASAVFNDDGPYNSTGASIARLDASSLFPQVIATHFTGGAHCCTIMKVLTFVDGRWETVNVGEFDSDGPQIEDLNGDGVVELVGKDQSFDYAFASYAESYAPPKVFRLTGGRLADISRTPEVRRPILQMLLANQGLATQDGWRDNGFLAGWVAHSTLVGNGVDAWRKMLDLYNRNSDWDLSVCTVTTRVDDPCPEYAKRHRDFPTALREHLVKNGYLVAGAAAESATVVGVRPSFDCNKARAPSEISICRLPRLAELDNILAAGYAFIKTNQGRAAADAIGIPYWHAIAQCEGVEECIAKRQSEEIVALARAGAPVSLPASVSVPANAPQQEPPAAAALTQEPTPAPKPEHVASSGTGFFVTADGAVVTNAHVVEDCLAINVTSDQEATAVARVVARDARNDLALLRTGLPARKAAAFRTSIRLGEGVEAFGYPLTEVLSKSGNFTIGNVSALVGLGEDSRYLQISAPVQPGNSGGPLLDQNGNLVGIVSAKLNALRLMVATNGDIAQNVNFAIKSSIVASFLEANGVGYATGAAAQPMQPADLAEQAKGVSVYVECQ